MSQNKFLQRAEHTINRIRDRLNAPRKDPSLSERDIERMVLHLESISQWNIQDRNYVEPNRGFPNNIYVAIAVCHKSCGDVQLLVDGSTQECDNCGRLMYRTETREYITGPVE